MKKIWNILFKHRNENFDIAVDRLDAIKSKIDIHPKQIRYKEIYITEINF